MKGFHLKVLNILFKNLAPLVRSALKQNVASSFPPQPSPVTRISPAPATRAPPPPPPPPPPPSAVPATSIAIGLTAAFSLGYLAAHFTGPPAAAPPSAPPQSPLLPSASPAPADAISLGTGAVAYRHTGLGFTADFDPCTRNPRWVAERMTPASLSVAAARQGQDFHEEAALPPSRRARLAAYTGSGYDRGHLASAAAHRSSASELADTFTLTNCAPQDPRLNRDLWARLEAWSRALVSSSSESSSSSSSSALPALGKSSSGRTWSNVHVVTGPLYLPSLQEPGTAAGAGAGAAASSPPTFHYSHAAIGAPLQWLAVPTHFFKVILATDGSLAAAEEGGAPGTPTPTQPLALAAFLVANAPPRPGASPLAAHLVPITVLEAVSGLSFFPAAVGEQDKLAADARLAVALQGTGSSAAGNVAGALLGGRTELLGGSGGGGGGKAAALQAFPVLAGGGAAKAAAAQQQQQRVFHVCELTTC